VWSSVNVPTAAGDDGEPEKGVGTVPSPQSIVPLKISGTTSRAVHVSWKAAPAAATRPGIASSVGATLVIVAVTGVAGYVRSSSLALATTE
jgi:hypothetical protein